MGDWVRDISYMQRKFGIQAAIDKMNPEIKKKYLEFRMKFLEEEFNEIKKAYQEGDAEGFIDGIIDFSVVGIGTLEGFGIDTQLAWDNVHGANMEKQPGVKENRPNPLGLPDLIKPPGWKAPSHAYNHGDLKDIM